MLPGWLIPVLVLLPNLLWLLFPPGDAPAAEHVPKSLLVQLMEVLEWLGRLGCLVIPVFYRVEMQTAAQVGALAVTAAALLFYYAGWARYFLNGRKYRLLFEPFLGVPLPLATGPIVLFFAAAVLLESWPMAASALVLAVGHVYLSWQSARVLGKRPLAE